LLHEGTPLLGLLTFPMLGERYVFAADRPPTYNGLPIFPSVAVRPDDENFIMMCTRTPRRYRVTTPLKARILGSAAYHLALVARSAAYAVIEATPKLWDLAAALPLLVAVGGSYQGLLVQTPLFPLPPQRRDYGALTYPLLGAATPALLTAVAPGIEPIAR
jgi:myo-inositol-1(or 4)-monophosphatase